MPFFSVVLTTFNRAHLIENAIRSLMLQTESDFEVIIMDDGSADDSEKVIKRMIAKDTRFSYYRNNQNREVVEAKNRGISFCQGKYVTFLDSDDEYKPEHLASRKKVLMNDSSIIFLYGGVQILGEPCVPDVKNPGQMIEIKKCAASGTFFFHREKCKDLAHFEEPALASDKILFERLSSNVKTVKTEIPTYIYHHDTTDSVTMLK